MYVDGVKTHTKRDDGYSTQEKQTFTLLINSQVMAARGPTNKTISLATWLVRIHFSTTEERGEQQIDESD